MPAYFRILAYGRRHFRLGAAAVLAMGAYTVFSAASLISVIPFLEILFQAPAEAPRPLPWDGSAAGLKAWGYAWLTWQMASAGREQVLIGFCIGLFVLIALKNTFRYLAAYWMAPLEQGIVQEMRSQVFAHLLTLDLGFFHRRKKGDLMSVLVSDVQAVQESVIGTLQSLIREPVTMVAFLGALLLISWKLTLFSLLALPAAALAINTLARPLKRKSRQSQDLLGELSALIDETLGGIRIVKAFQKEAWAQQRYDAQNQRFARLQISVARRTELASPLTELISIAVVCVLIYYGALLILDRQSPLKASEFLGFIAVFSQLLAPMKVFSNAAAKILRGTAAFGRIEQLMQEQPQVQAPAQGLRPAGLAHGIRFEGVSFSYGSGEVLRDVSFSMQAGTTTALVGPSGAGKSTLADLIPRFYDPQQGRILLDGADLRTIDPGALRSLIGIVSQDPILFHDTIFSNIAYGLPGARPEEVEAAAKAAFAHDFILQLPQQYQTLIGDRGVMLSGGQRQRIAIARALLRNPAILILDEATSNLDTESEQWVQRALERLMAGRTALVIAHRLSTVQHAGQILVLSEGRIVERGTHQSLLQAGGLYQRLALTAPET
ncbi:MAG: ABC transporter ATP-binding protein [Bacteroidia bacterium]|nr:ABC transporter ATP-binding protein [Bacteroidia bacterium]